MLELLVRSAAIAGAGMLMLVATFGLLFAMSLLLGEFSSRGERIAGSIGVFLALWAGAFLWMLPSSVFP